MTQLDALKELAEKVEAGDHVAGPAERAFGVARYGSVAIAAHLGSLDAAKALHEAVLPDDWTAMLADWGPQNEWTCQLSALLFEPIESGNKCPARAWLLAIIRAKIAELESET